jgi:hypothetical protein
MLRVLFTKMMKMNDDDDDDDAKTWATPPI